MRGIEVGLKKTNSSEIMSIAAIKDSDFNELFKLIPLDQSLEINFSCPNLDEKSPLSWNDASVFNNSPSNRKYCIAKIAPTTTIDQLTFLIDNLGYAPEQVAISGDSAGGHLALITLLKLKEDGVQLPSALALLSPWTDPSLSLIHI